VAGGWGTTRGGALVLCYLALAPLFLGGALLWARRRRRGRPLPALRVLRPAFAVLVAIGFLLMFAGVALEDLRLLNDYREASCEVLDSSASVALETSRSGGTQASFSPVLAVRFQAEGREWIGTGFDGPSRLRVGGGAGLLREMETMRSGQRLTCWYDPADPARIVVKRGPGGAYVFVLLPLGLLAIAVSMLRGAVGR
jgi:hypothetical protein